jgi:hypothetical protein
MCGRVCLRRLRRDRVRFLHRRRRRVCIPTRSPAANQVGQRILLLRSRYPHRDRACMSINRLRVFHRRSRRRSPMCLYKRRRRGGIRLQELRELPMGHRRDSLRLPRLRRRRRLTPNTIQKLQTGTIRKPPMGIIRKLPMGTIRKLPMGIIRKLPMGVRMGRRRREGIRLLERRMIRGLRTEIRMGRGGRVQSHRLRQRLRLQRRITGGLRVCRRMLLGRSGRCHRYRFTRRG